MATKISAKQLGDDVIKLISSGGGALDKDITSNIAVGAAGSGTLFPSGQTLTEFAEALLRKDITPTITTSFSGSGTKEMGTTVNGTTMKLTIGNLSSVTVPITKVEFYVGNTLVDSQNFVSGQAAYTFTYNNLITTNTTCKAKLFYNGTSSEGSGTFNFVYGSFVGVTSIIPITDAIATDFTGSFAKIIKTAKGYTWDNISVSDERFCYMYPQSLGTLSSIKDGNGFENIGSYTRYTVNITYPTNGASVPYYVYLLTDATTGSGFKQIYA